MTCTNQTRKEEAKDEKYPYRATRRPDDKSGGGGRSGARVRGCNRALSATVGTGFSKGVVV